MGFAAISDFDPIAEAHKWQGPISYSKYGESHLVAGLRWAARALAKKPAIRMPRPVALCPSAKNGLAAGQLLCRRCKGAGSILDYAPSSYGDPDQRVCVCWECDGNGLTGARAIMADHATHIITGIASRYLEDT